MKLPKDIPARKIGTRARSIVPYKLNSDIWDWHEITGTDHGTDMILEFIENDKYVNKNIDCQIKGTKSLPILKSGVISFKIEIKTLNYALSSSRPFVLLVVDILKEDVYYLLMQDYFISNKEFFEKLNQKQDYLNVHIPMTNRLNKNSIELVEIAKKTYIGGPNKSLREAK